MSATGTGGTLAAILFLLRFGWLGAICSFPAPENPPRRAVGNFYAEFRRVRISKMVVLDVGSDILQHVLCHGLLADFAVGRAVLASEMLAVLQASEDRGLVCLAKRRHDLVVDAIPD